MLAGREGYTGRKGRQPLRGRHHTRSGGLWWRLRRFYSRVPHALGLDTGGDPGEAHLVVRIGTETAATVRLSDLRLLHEVCYVPPHICSCGHTRPAFVVQVVDK